MSSTQTDGCDVPKITRAFGCGTEANLFDESTFAYLKRDGFWGVRGDLFGGFWGGGCLVSVGQLANW